MNRFEFNENTHQSLMNYFPTHVAKYFKIFINRKFIYFYSKKSFIESRNFAFRFLYIVLWNWYLLILTISSSAKRRIEEVGSLLRMNRRQTDMAYGFYQSALNRGWTRGRQVKLVTAACLYIVCRLEGTSHMLLDLSDVLEVNVYTLGKTYMEMAKRLNIQIPALGE